MPKYNVDMSYTATVTYTGTVEVEAENEEAAEEAALAEAQKPTFNMSGWNSDEDSGDFAVDNVEEIE